MTNFIREVQIFVGALTEVQGGGSKEQALVIKSSGRDDELNIEFKVSKNTMGSPNFSTITFYNLSNKTRQAMSKPKTSLEIQAGYQQGNISLQTIAKGSISSIIGSREDGDIKVIVNAYDGAEGMGVGKYSSAYQGQAALSKIVEDVAKSLPGVQVSSSNIQLGSQRVGRKGLTVAGRSSSILENLSRHWGFSWSVQNGVFKAIPDQSSSGATFEVSSELGNLISAVPRNDNVLQTIVGVEITTVLDPRLQPYDNIKLVSTVSPELNKTYQITNLTHQGSIRGNTWETVVECLFSLGNIKQTGG